MYLYNQYENPKNVYLIKKGMVELYRKVHIKQVPVSENGLTTSSEILRSIECEEKNANRKEKLKTFTISVSTLSRG